MSAARRARRGVVELDATARAALVRAGARGGVVHAAASLVVVGLGTAGAVELPRGLHDPDAPARVAAALGAVELTGEPGPGGTGVLAMGALPFDPDAPGALAIPSLLCAWDPAGTDAWATAIARDGEPPVDVVGAVAAAAAQVAPLAPIPGARGTEARPEPAAFEAAVAACVARLRAGDAQKVVLARSVTGCAAGSVDAAAVADALHALDPACDLYAVAAPRGRFVGASPELVVAVSDGAVCAHPLAGTVALGDGDDDARVAWLLASEKNRAEHAVVVEDLVARLAPLCDALHAASAPSVVRLSTNARLGTWVDGKLLGPRDASTAIGALAALHPTAAVGGVPRDVARRLIDELEIAPRGLWAGPVGWVDADGTATWTLALRGVTLLDEAFEVFGGAGIVAASDPRDELDETEEKLRSVLRVLGV